jgi:carboxyl-terminal processing protease
VDEIDKITQDIFSKPINLQEDETLTLEPKLKKVPANKQEQYNEWKNSSNTISFRKLNR